jgi:hypothetical protein
MLTDAVPPRDGRTVSSPVIKIQGLAKSYRGVPAVHDVSLTVEDGEVSRCSAQRCWQDDDS